MTKLTRRAARPEMGAGQGACWCRNRLILDAFDDYRGGKPPIRQLRFMEVPELSSRINGLLSGQYDFACDITPDQLEIKENWGQVLTTAVPRAINDNSMTAFFNDPVSCIPRKIVRDGFPCPEFHHRLI